MSEQDILDIGQSKHPGGRPNKHAEIDLEKVKRCAESGMNNDQIAIAIGIASSTLYEYQKDWPEFSEALKAGKVDPDDEIEASLFLRAKGFSRKTIKQAIVDGGLVDVEEEKYFPPDPVSGIFWLCNRRKKRWRHVSHIEHSGPDGGPIETSDVSKEERDVVLARLRKVESAGAVG